jgi:hypothetical protein
MMDAASDDQAPIDHEVSLIKCPVHVCENSL